MYNGIYMAINFVEIFQNLGLTPSETKTYFASFQLGPSSIQEIAKKSKLSRTAVYDAVASLQDRGIISTTTRGKKTIYTAEDPERVIAHFKARMKEMEGQIEVLQSAKNELALLGGGERPAVRFYEGKESLRALFLDVIQSGAHVIREISSIKQVSQWTLLPDYRKERAKYFKGRNIETRIVYKGTLPDTARKTVTWTAMGKRAEDFRGDIWVYGDRIALITLEEKMVLVIVENEVLARTMRTIFDELERTLKLEK